MESSKTVVGLVGGGRPIHLNLAELPSITWEGVEKPDTMPLAHFDPKREVKFTFKPQKISRKRFVRNMCSIGYTKKQAKRIAWAVKMPYHAAWFLAGLGALDESGKVDERRFSRGQNCGKR